MTLSQENFTLINTAEWEIWYQDNFDLECPRQMELSGCGLVKGLIELWVRHLYETIQPSGILGFSRFNLWWKQHACSINIMGEMIGQIKLRLWVFGERKVNYLGCMKIADQDILQVIAEVHSQFIIRDQTSEAIVSEVLQSNSKEEFIRQISMSSRSL